MCNLYREHSIDASYQVSVHLAKWFRRRRFFRNRPIRNKNCQWWPYLFTDRHKMNNLHREPSIDVSYQVSVHLAQQFQIFLEIGLSETRIACGGHVHGWERNVQSLQSIFHKCFLLSFGSFGLAVSEEKIFQKSTNQKQELPVAVMFINRSGQNVQTFHRCFLPSFALFSQAVSEEKIFKNRPIKNKNCLWQPCLLTDLDEMRKLYRGPSIDASYQVSVHLAKWCQRRRLKCENLTDDRRQMMAKAHFAFGKVS